MPQEIHMRFPRGKRADRLIGRLENRMVGPCPVSMIEFDNLLDHPKTSHVDSDDLDHPNRIIPSFHCWGGNPRNGREWSVWIVQIIGIDV